MARSFLPLPLRHWTDRHTLALLSLMSSDPRLPAPEGAGSPTSSCHWPKAPRAFFTRHFLTSERSKQRMNTLPAKSDRTLDTGQAGAFVSMLGLLHLMGNHITWEVKLGHGSSNSLPSPPQR